MAGDAAIEICEAVKDKLNTVEFAHVFTASRSYDLVSQVTDDGITHVDCGVHEEDGEIATRGMTAEEIGIDIVVRRKCDVSSNAIPDAMMGLLKQFKDAFVGERLATATLADAFCHGYERKPAYFHDHIRKYRQFTGLLTLHFSIALEMP